MVLKARKALTQGACCGSVHLMLLLSAHLSKDGAAFVSPNKDDDKVIGPVNPKVSGTVATLVPVR